MSIRFGASPINWINDDMPELGAGTSLDTLLGDAAAIGYDGVELGGIFPRDPDSLAAALAPHGLKLAAGWYSTALLERDAEEEIAALEPHLRLLEAMGCNVFIAAETTRSVHCRREMGLRARPMLDEDSWRMFASRLTTVSEYVAARGFKLAYHYHLGTVVQDALDIDRLLGLTPAHVGLVLDTGHAVLGGLDPVDLILAHPERIAHVHCKDIRPPVFAAVEDRGGSFLDGIVDGMFTVPGDGAIAFGPVLRALAAIDYEGWLIVEAEQDPGRADPRVYARMGLEALRREGLVAGLTPALAA